MKFLSMSTVYLVLALLSIGLVFCAVIGVVYLLSKRVPKKIRVNMDELPSTLSKFWWLINFFQYYVVSYLPDSLIAKRKKLLESAGLEFFLAPNETFALQCLGAFFLSLVAFLISTSSGFSFFEIFSVTLIFSVLGWFYPLMWMKEQQKKRSAELLRSMPSFLDILTLCTECGLSLGAALNHYCEKGPNCALRREMERALRDIKSGSSRIEALGKVGIRMASPDFSMFVSLVAQSEKLGTPLGEALRRFSEQKRTERFQRAEKLAMEAPMKIIGPLVIFIFPITFIIIAFPIVSSMMQDFGR